VEGLFNPEYRIIDLSHITPLSRTNSVLVVNIEKWKTFDEFLADARKSTLSTGLPGIGSTSQLNGLILMDGLGIKINWVPFGGSPEALAALAGKHIDSVVAGSNVALPLVKAGKLRPLLALTDGKDIVFPTIPVAKELGYNFNFAGTIRGVDGPPKMPVEIVNVIEKAFAKAVKEPGYLAWAKERTLEVYTLSSKEYQKLIEGQQREVEKYKAAFKSG
jgi:tripartite-type tricarboxylate transporter receptor subunit TctC